MTMEFDNLLYARVTRSLSWMFPAKSIALWKKRRLISTLRMRNGFLVDSTRMNGNCYRLAGQTSKIALDYATLSLVDTKGFPVGRLQYPEGSLKRNIR